MSEAWAEAIHKLIEYEFAIEKVFGVIRNFFGYRFKENTLDFSKYFRRFTALSGESRVGLFPLSELSRSLALGGTHLFDELFQQFVLSILSSDQLLKNVFHFGSLIPTISVGGRVC